MRIYQTLSLLLVLSLLLIKLFQTPSVEITSYSFHLNSFLCLSTDCATPRAESSAEAFIGVMLVLSSHNFILWDSSTNSYKLKEPLLVDYLYTSIPFRQRTKLHGFAAEWYMEYTSKNLSNASMYYPKILHHFNAAFQEARSASILQLLMVRGKATNFFPFL